MLLDIMRPHRDHFRLGKHLKEYRSRAFSLNAANYTRTLRLCSNMDQIENQLALESYTHNHVFKPRHFNNKRITIQVSSIIHTKFFFITFTIGYN